MKINEQNYLNELLNRNEEALEYIIDNYSALVNGVVRNVLNSLCNEGLIEECISDIFLGVWNNIDKFKGDNSKFKSWIAGISKYKAIDYYRKYKKGQEDNIENYCISDNSNLEEKVICGIETDKVMKLISEFKEPDKSIIVMKFLLGYSSKKISQCLGLTSMCVDTKICRARKKIKSQYIAVNKEGRYE